MESILTTKDILNLSLAGGFILLVIFLCVTALYLILILRDISKITAHAKHTAKKVNDAILQPVKFLYAFGGKMKPIFDIIEEKIRERAENINGDKKEKGRKRKNER